jgi:hypothetical protein
MRRNGCDLGRRPGASIGVANAAPASLEVMARETGLEPAASAVTGRRSNQLSYSRGCRNQRLIRTDETLKGAPPFSQGC